MSRLVHGNSLPAVVFLCCFFGQALADQGDDSAFFQQRSQLAYNAVLGLPVVAPRLVQLREWQVSVEHSNQFTGGRANDETLLLDGESTRLAISHRQRFGPCWQLEATVPFISHHQGRFDRAIDEWHKFWGLPDANRDSSQFNRLIYHYTDASGIKHNITTAQSGIGDVQVAVQRALGCFATADSTGANPMIRAGIKLPTGNPTELRGSGEFDFFADWQSPIWTNNKRWRGGLALGLLMPMQTDRFAEQESLVLYGSVGAQLLLSHKLRLIVQLDGHSPFYRSALRELGDPSFNVVLGGRYLAGRALSYELSFSEDAAIDTTPDIVLRFAMTYRPESNR